jgi:DNA polymerase elongation subunit (family B)
MTKFYTTAIQRGSKVLVRGYNKGRRFEEKVDFEPSLFVPGPGEYRTLSGESLSRRKFESIRHAKDFVRDHQDVHGFSFYGMTRYNYQWIVENYIDSVPYDFNQLKIAILDIETTVENGFPDIFDPNEKVLLINVTDYNSGESVSFGTKEYDDTDKPFKYVYCKTEEELFHRFLAHWSFDHPDIITGWNTDGFDIPYLYARVTRVLGDGAFDRMSPFGVVDVEDRVFNEQRELNINIIGVSSLDYLSLYKKFGQKTQENYKLDTVASDELKTTKLDNPFDTFKEWYTHGWDTFVEYNHVDTDLIKQLENKKALLRLAVALAYKAKINFQDVFSPVRTWDVIIYEHLYRQNIIVPQPIRSNDTNKIEGAYVKEPVPGLYDWVVSFDLNSLYPHIIMSLNMSPETFVGMTNVTVEQLLNGDRSMVVGEYALAANGSMYDQSKTGFLPTLMKDFYQSRKVEKRQMLDAETILEKDRASATKEHIKELENIISSKNALQNALKTLLNSAYGGLANRGFRFFDNRLAEGITKTGQLVIQTAERNANIIISKLSGVEDDYTIASDTDSLYLHVNPVVNKFCKDKSKEQIATFLEKACSDKIGPSLNAKSNQLAESMNWNQDLLVFKLEVVADRGLWSAKKKYALHVYSSEGVRYEKPEIKIKGLTIVQSSTPGIVRKHLKKSVELLLTSTEDELRKYARFVEEEFMKTPPEKIAFPRSANNIAHYSSPRTIYGNKTPIAVRASLLYNHYLKEYNLTTKYEAIREGNKIKWLYLREPNIIGEDVIGFQTVLPEEFKLHKYVDYNLMFEKTYLKPLNDLLKHTDISLKDAATLEDLFS